MASTHLVGVFLSVLTYRGPQLVYHYYDPTLVAGPEEMAASSDSSIEWSDDDSLDDEVPLNSNPTSPVLSAKTGSQYSVSSGPPISGSNSSKLGPGGEDLAGANTPQGSAFISAGNGDESGTYEFLGPFAEESKAKLPPGFDEDVIAEILCPPESLCNKKFSLTVENNMFVGIPVHILESGTWRPLKEGYANTVANTAANAGTATPVSADADANANTNTNTSAGFNNNTSAHTSANISANTSANTSANISANTSANADANVNADTSLNSSRNSENGETTSVSHSPEIVETKVKTPQKVQGVVTEDDSPMRMFHVCFLSDPPINEATLSETRIYENVLVPLIRALRQEQASKNYVWHEIAKMQRVSENTVDMRASERQEVLEANSELARALRDICSAIANMEIARVTIAGKPRAFQVPLQLELSQIPGFYDEVPPHAYLSTSNCATKDIGHDSYECYGLLLLGDPEDIVKEIDVDPKGPVAMMIRNISPVSSLEELARQNRIEIKQIVNLVWSLVYWRRARIIIPLSFRHVYSVSPLAPTERINQLAKQFHDLFPVIPPLQRLLSLLSTTKPKPFSMHVPSADHRPIYMHALAWLLQNDLVVHLPTFAQILITRKIKLASMNVEEEEEMQGAGGGDPPSGMASGENANANTAGASNYRDTENSGPNTAMDALASNEEAVSDMPLNDDTIAGQLRRRKWLRRQSSSYKADLEDIQESIIVDPRRATPLERRWLAQVAVSGVTRSPELAAMFQRLTKYFNSRDNLEQMMVKEKIPREEMRRFLQEFQPYILTYRHW